MGGSGEPLVSPHQNRKLRAATTAWDSIGAARARRAAGTGSDGGNWKNSLDRRGHKLASVSLCPFARRADEHHIDASVAVPVRQLRQGVSSGADLQDASLRAACGDPPPNQFAAHTRTAALRGKTPVAIAAQQIDENLHGDGHSLPSLGPPTKDEVSRAAAVPVSPGAAAARRSVDGSVVRNDDGRRALPVDRLLAGNRRGLLPRGFPRIPEATCTGGR